MISGQGIQLAVRFLYAIILARIFGPHDYGIIAYGISLYLAVMPFTKLGIEHVVIRTIGYDRILGEKILQNAQTLRKIITLASTTIFAIACFFWEHDVQTSKILLWFSLALMGRSFATWNAALFTAYEANQYSFRLQAIFRPLEVILGLTILFFWQNPLAVVITHVATWWAEVIFGTALLHKKFTSPGDAWEKNYIKKILPEAIPIGLTSGMSLIMTQGPLIFYKVIHGVGPETGNLALSMQIFGILSHFPISAYNASLPLLSRAAVRGDGRENLFIEVVLRFIIFSGTFLELTGMAFGDDAILYVFGSKYRDAGKIIGLIIWMMIPWSTMNALMKVQVARQKSRTSMIFLFIGVVFFITTTFLTNKNLGIYGPIIATMSGISIICLLLIVSIFQERKFNYILAIVKPLLATIAAVIIYHYLVTTTTTWISYLTSILSLISGWILCKCVSFKEIKAAIEFFYTKNYVRNNNENY